MLVGEVERVCLRDLGCLSRLDEGPSSVRAYLVSDSDWTAQVMTKNAYWSCHIDRRLNSRAKTVETVEMNGRRL